MNDDVRCLPDCQSGNEVLSIPPPPSNFNETLIYSYPLISGATKQ